MRLERIYSSKIYVTSTRKDRIHAAMQKATNAELVVQLEEYLDDNAQEELQYAKDYTAHKQVPSQENNSETVIPSESGDSASSSGFDGTPSSFTGDIMSDFGDDDLADIPADMSGDEASVETPEEPEAVESVTQEGRPITSTTATLTTLDDLVSECDIIKGTLNAREDTKGVIRLQVNDPELWIYFNDDSNLNDKMIEVISVLNSTGYTYLKFNRLARSNNAIVFDIDLNVEYIKTVNDIEEKN